MGRRHKAIDWVAFAGFLLIGFMNTGCGRKKNQSVPNNNTKATPEHTFSQTSQTGKTPGTQPATPATTPEKLPPPYTGPTVDTVLKAGQFADGIQDGMAIQNDALVLYRLSDDFTGNALRAYKISPEMSYPKDEYGVQDHANDAATVTFQSKPDHCIFVETRDNDSVNISRRVTPTVKGFISFDIWPTRLWPSNGKLIVNLDENNRRGISYFLSGGDYKNPSVKRFDGKKLTAAGGRPYFSSITQFNIYSPSETIPKSEQRWIPVRLLFRPAYIAGSLDGSVCREINDPERNPIIVQHIALSIQQLETYIRTLKFKALLGEAVSAPLELTGKAWYAVQFDGNAPDKTRIGLQVRSADTRAGLKTAVWSGPAADTAYFLAPGLIPKSLATKKYLQIKILLKATIDAPFDATPTVKSVTVTQALGGDAQ